MMEVNVVSCWLSVSPDRTKIVAPPQDVQVIRGKDALLQCKYRVDQQIKYPTIQWKKNGYKILASANDDK